MWLSLPGRMLAGDVAVRFVDLRNLDLDAGLAMGQVRTAGS